MYVTHIHSIFAVSITNYIMTRYKKIIETIKNHDFAIYDFDYDGENKYFNDVLELPYGEDYILFLDVSITNSLVDCTYSNFENETDLSDKEVKQIQSLTETLIKNENSL